MGNEKKASAFVQSVKDMFISNPSIQGCDITSILSAAKKVAKLNLTIGGDMDIIPRGKEAKAEPNYKGLITLALRAGLFSKANTVFENDEFDLDIGSSEIKHKPCLRGDRGAAIGYYAVVTFQTGASVVDYMTKEEVQQFKKDHNLSSPAWSNYFNEMGKKTVLKRLLKSYMYSDPTGNLSEAITYDNTLEAETAEPEQDRFADLQQKPTKETKQKVSTETGEVTEITADEFDPEKDIIV
jgi:recombination protein RecT